MDLKSLSKAILLTQDVREESWCEKHAAYRLNVYEAAKVAMTALKLEKKLAHLVGLMCSVAWNDVQMWALDINADREVHWGEANRFWYNWESENLHFESDYKFLLQKVITNRKKPFTLKRRPLAYAAGKEEHNGN